MICETGRVLQYDSSSLWTLISAWVQRYDTCFGTCVSVNVFAIDAFYYAIRSAEVFPKHNMYSCTLEDNTKTECF